MIRLKRMFSVIAAGFVAALVLPAATFAATNYQLGGAAEIIKPGLNGSGAAVQLTADKNLPDEDGEARNAGGNVIFDALEGANFSSLNTLSSDYRVDEGTCGGGTRFYTMLNNDADADPDANIVYYFTCESGLTNSGNLAEGTDQVQVEDYTAGTRSTMTLDEAKALFPNATILEVSLVSDNINDAAGRQVITFDNVQINDQSFNFETKLSNKDACKNDGWRSSTDPTYKNQGDCVSSFASKKQQTTTTSTSLLDRIRNIFR